MPLRIKRDTYLRSRRCATASWRAMCLWEALLSSADDYGRFTADPALIRPLCFPLRLQDVTEADIEADLQELASPTVRLLGLYRVGGDRLLQLYNFRQRVRVPSKYPAPPLDLLDQLEEPAGSAARTDARAAGSASRTDDGHLRAPDRGSPSDDGQLRASARLDVVVGVVEDVVVVEGGGVVGADAPPPPDRPPHGLRAVDPPAARTDPPVQTDRPPAVAPGCDECAEMLRTLNELTGRFYSAPGRTGLLVHDAHVRWGLEKCLATIRREVEVTLSRPGKARFLAPQVLFKPEQWDTAVNQADAAPDPDALQPLRLG